MINRVLIRIKVVQLLYSYLISEKNFTLESQPTPPTKQTRFAYRLYLDILVLMYRLALAIEHPKGHFPLLDNRFIKTIAADDKIKSLSVQYRTEPFPLEPALSSLTAELKASAIYKSYIKLRNKGGDNLRTEDVKFWREVFNLLIMKSAVVGELFSKYENFSIRGVERTNDLVEETFLNFSSSNDNVSDALKSLRESLEKAYDLYLLLLWMPVQITDMQAERLEMGRNKFLPDEEDINPDMRFVENRMVQALESDTMLRELIEKRKLNWKPDNEQLLQHLLKEILASEEYRNYMTAPTNDLAADCELWRNLMRHVIFKDEDFIEALEEMSVYWNDDLDIIGTFVLKTFKRVDEAAAGKIQDDPVLPMYKDEEDAAFAAELFRTAAVNKEEYRRYIDKFINEEHWDRDRLAFMDVVIVLIAISELLNFPKIPIRVTVNEYIEMAKAYSTPKSGQFVNGILGSIIGWLKVERKLLKED